MASTPHVANAGQQRGQAGVTAGTRHVQTGNTGERISAGVCVRVRVFPYPDMTSYITLDWVA